MQVGKAGARFAREHRGEFACFAREGVIGGMEQQRDFIALGEAVEDVEAALHEVCHGLRHQVAKARVKGRVKLPDVFGEAGKAAAVQADDDVVAHGHAEVVGGLIRAHQAVEVVKFHQFSP